MSASLPCTASYFPNQLHTQKIAASFRSTFLNVKLNIRCSPRRRFNSSIQEKPRKIICANANNKNSIPIPDRLLAAVGYFLPFFDGVQYGRFFLRDFPSAQLLLQPLPPAIRVYKSYPYASILVLIILYFYVVPNPNIRRYVRFNVMQAVALDVLLTVADIVNHAFEPQNGIGLSLLTSFDNTVFLFLLTCLVYGSTSCLMGRVARLPLVADAAETQLPERSVQGCVACLMLIPTSYLVVTILEGYLGASLVMCSCKIFILKYTSSTPYIYAPRNGISRALLSRSCQNFQIFLMFAVMACICPR